jgi:hypothetical protein
MKILCVFLISFMKMHASLISSSLT